MLDVQRLFRNHFGHPPTYTTQAPASVELLGSYAEHQHGLALGLAVSRMASMSVSARVDGKIELIGEHSKTPETFSILSGEVVAGSAGARLIQLMLQSLRQRQAHCSGFNAAIHTTIPAGAGMGDSVALQIATALAIRQLHPFRLTGTGVTVPPKRLNASSTLPPLTTTEKIEIARTCLIGQHPGSTDLPGVLGPITSLFGKAFHAIEVDCQSLAVEPVPFVGEVTWVICDSGVRISDRERAILRLREEWNSAASALGVKSLRTVDKTFLNGNRRRLTERQHQCAIHFVGETQRVIAGSRALRDGDLAQFGQFMYQSHESARDSLQNSCAELELLVSLAKIHPGCLGTRLTGSGFGGATLSLVLRGQADGFAKAVATVYEKHTGIHITPVLCEAVNGAS